MLGKIKGRRTRELKRMRWLDGITDSVSMGLSKLQEIVKDRETWHAAVHGATSVRYDWVTKQECKPARKPHWFIFLLFTTAALAKSLNFLKETGCLTLLAGKSFDSSGSLNQSNNRYGSQVSKNTVLWRVLSWNNTVFPRCVFTTLKMQRNMYFVSLGIGAW